MKLHIKSVCVAVLVGMLGIFAAGCQNSENEQSAADNGLGEYIPFEAVNETVSGRDDVYAVLKVVKSQYWQDIIDGMTQAANEKGFNLYVGGCVVESDYDVQAQMMEEAKKRGAEAIILSPANSNELVEPVKRIHDSDIPVILVDTILNGDDYDTCFMTDNLQAGAMEAEEVIRLMRENGVMDYEDAQIAIQIASESSQTIIDRIAGFNQYWSVYAPPTWELIDDIKVNDGDAKKAKQNCLDFIEEYPNLKAVVGCNNSSTVGFAVGLKESGRTDIVLGGFDFADETAELIKSEDWKAATVVQRQYNMGYDGALTAFELINGASSDYKFSDTGVLIVNSENYDSYVKEVNN